jgi:hypothetical protein
MRIVRGVHM